MKFPIRFNTIGIIECPLTAKPKPVRFRSPRWLSKLEFFVHKTVTGKQQKIGTQWNLTEVSTGMAVVRDIGTRRNAIILGRAKLLRNGRRKVLPLIGSHLLS